MHRGDVNGGTEKGNGSLKELADGRRQCLPKARPGPSDRGEPAEAKPRWSVGRRAASPDARVARRGQKAGAPPGALHCPHAREGAKAMIAARQDGLSFEDLLDEAREDVMALAAWANAVTQSCRPHRRPRGSTGTSCARAECSAACGQTCSCLAEGWKSSDTCAVAFLLLFED